MNALGLFARVAAGLVAVAGVGGVVVFVAGLASVPRLVVPAIAVVGVVTGVLFWLYLAGCGGASRADTVYW